MSGLFLFLAAFLASVVEMVEALTIVLAVGLTRGWRSALIGTGAGARWPGGDLSILGILAVYALVSWGYVTWLRREKGLYSSGQGVRG